MSLARRLAPSLLAAFTSPGFRNLRRSWAEVGRKVRRQPHRVYYFHQVDDPYSHLAAQTLARFAAGYDVDLLPQLVGPPPDQAAPEREKLEGFSRKDAADIAVAYGLEFPADAKTPKSQIVEVATDILAALTPDDFARRAADVGTVVWQGKAPALAQLGRELPPADSNTSRARLAAGNELRRKLGHYLGATFYYGGEWYWGVDRLHYLEDRLRELGLARGDKSTEYIAATPRQPAAAESAIDSANSLTLEFYPSLRSPYSAISMDRVYDLAARYPVELQLRPVLPMVMRGLPVPLAKRLYIVLDTKREAERAGVPFGRICDPVGEPVEKAFALFPWARQQGRGAELLRSFTNAAFAEGVDTGTDEGLRHVVETAGLSWSDAQSHRGETEWRDELEKNRADLFALGLWGVPSFRLRGGSESDFCTWGQDRIWLVEREIVRRLSASRGRHLLE